MDHGTGISPSGIAVKDGDRKWLAMRFKLRSPSDRRYAARLSLKWRRAVAGDGRRRWRNCGLMEEVFEAWGAEASGGESGRKAGGQLFEARGGRLRLGKVAICDEVAAKWA
ncbi:hypothetical protein E2562_010183 [Oryza meyeriana var. granulata]|uniref:Uncharacterized protein n=1 Tax=Oryza meyeriana var. granulata TaxID=110450 RepID=A0A6G1EKQ6_9ORYZ|nr:hypothetical protein E2562_010183 [Oryza meyeriana var. granulata]